MKSAQDSPITYNITCGSPDEMRFEYWLNYLCFRAPDDSSGAEAPSAKTYSFVFAFICILEQAAIVVILRKSLKKKKAIEEARKLKSIRNYHKNYAILTLKLI
jgi:hypothetical protein